MKLSTLVAAINRAFVKRTLIFIVAAGEASMPLAHGLSSHPAVCIDAVDTTKISDVKPATPRTTM